MYSNYTNIIVRGVHKRVTKEHVLTYIQSQIEYNLHKYVTDDKVKVQFHLENNSTDMKITMDNRVFVKVNRDNEKLRTL